MKATTDEEYQNIVRQFSLVSTVTVIIILSGTIFYHFVEKLSWVDSLYFCAVTLATVGYGDITPHTAAGKIFTVLYIFVGVGIIAAFVNIGLKRAVMRRRHND